MKKFALAVAVAMAIPSLAHAAEGDKKHCCCEEKDGKKGCCDDKAKDGHMDHGSHEGHDMSKPKG